MEKWILSYLKDSNHHCRIFAFFIYVVCSIEEFIMMKFRKAAFFKHVFITSFQLQFNFKAEVVIMYCQV